MMIGATACVRRGNDYGYKNFEQYSFFFFLQQQRRHMCLRMSLQKRKFPQNSFCLLIVHMGPKKGRKSCDTVPLTPTERADSRNPQWILTCLYCSPA